MKTIAKFDLIAKDPTGAELRQFFHEILPGTIDYPGCLGTSLQSDKENKARIMLLETWKSQTDFEKYLNWRTERGDFAKLLSLIEGEPHLEFFDFIE